MYLAESICYCGRRKQWSTLANGVPMSKILTLLFMLRVMPSLRQYYDARFIIEYEGFANIAPVANKRYSEGVELSSMWWVCTD